MFIISGPSGAGKGTVIQGVLAQRPDMKLSVSATTRPARSMEIEGTHYHFVSDRDFALMRERGEFLEWAEVHGNLYGTPRAEVDRQLAGGQDVILEIDVQGAVQAKAAVPEALLIFVEPPSMQILRQRLRDRKTESQETMDRRVSAAHEELRRKNLYDGVIVNLDVGQAVQEMLSLIDQLKERDG